MSLDAFLGSDEVKAQLLGQLHSGSWPHSLLILGENGCGRGFFARLLAAEVLAADPAAQDGAARARRVLEGADPDCIEVEGEGVSGQIRVDRIREVRTEAQQTSLSGSRRVVILYNAQDMNPAAANALLKILEEPPEGVCFLLTAESAASVLPTVRSRCQSVRLLAPAPAVCEGLLRKNGVATADAAHLSAVWDGCVGSALACTRPARRALFETAEALCRCIAAGDEYRMMQLFLPYEKAKQPKEEDEDGPAAPVRAAAPLRGKADAAPDDPAAAFSVRRQLQTVLEDAVQILRGSLAGRDSCGVSAAQAVPAVEAIRAAMHRLAGNGNPKLILTLLSLQLAGVGTA